MSKKLYNIDWHCDQCNAYLNSQDGFNTDCGIWQCEECGFSNPINEDFVLSEEEYDSFISSGYDSYNEYAYENDDSERMSPYDAALIWQSHGRDEDYMFGYTEAELENALDD